MCLLYGACTPNTDALGETEWVLFADAVPVDGGSSMGQGGQVALADFERLVLVEPSGDIRWRTLCARECGVPAVGDDGAVYEATRGSGRVEMVKYAAPDGAIEWSRSFPGTSEKVQAVASVDGTEWLLVNSTDPIDLGGGPLIGATVWARYDAEGGYLDGGSLDFKVDLDEISRPAATAEGGLIVSSNVAGRTWAFDAGGEEVWSVASSSVFAAHENGDVTSCEWTGPIESGSWKIIRRDRARDERWSYTTPRCPWAMMALTGGGLIMEGSEGLIENTIDAYHLKHIDERGNETTEVFPDAVSLAVGSVVDSYRFVTFQTVDIHDWPQPARRGSLVARSAP
jgi:hypothetical protein